MTSRSIKAKRSAAAKKGWEKRRQVVRIEAMADAQIDAEAKARLADPVRAHVLCIDCKWLDVPEGKPERGICRHPIYPDKTEASPITGAVTTMRQEWAASIARRNYGTATTCGPDARLFEAKEPGKPITLVDSGGSASWAMEVAVPGEPVVIIDPSPWPRIASRLRSFWHKATGWF